MRECNYCNRPNTERGCRLIKSSRWLMSGDTCEYYQSLPPLKVKLLELILDDFTNLSKVLRGLNMRIIPDGHDIQVVDA